jgi:glucokinase
MPKDSSSRPVVGVDLGATKVLAGVVDANYKILAAAKRATKGGLGVEAVVERLAKTAKDAVKAANLTLDDVAGVCSAAPGALNPHDGIVRFAPIWRLGEHPAPSAERAARRRARVHRQ